jgi:uncharacterized membrane protein
MFDSPEQIQGYVKQIQVRVVDTHNMPLANKTGMTEPERLLIARWIAQGAPIDTKVPPRAAPAALAEPAVDVSAPKKSADALARVYFKKKCVVCHGERGAGDGPGAGSLEPKPRNLADASWQKSVTDDELEKIIVSGGAAVGKSSAMPPNPDLKKKREVLTELVRLVRGLGS